MHSYTEIFARHLEGGKDEITSPFTMKLVGLSVVVPNVVHGGFDGPVRSV